MQRYRTVIILVLLVVVPLAAAVLAARFFLPGSGAKTGQAEAKPVAAPSVKKQKTRKIFGAARGLPVGTLLTEEDLTGLDLPPGEIKRGHVVMDGPKAIDALLGHAVRESLTPGAPLIRAAVVGPGQRGFLAAVLRPGTRAVTIQLGAGTRHAGLIDPGDRVDVILTAKLRLDDRVQSVFARTILEDVRVVAVDRQVGTSAETADSGKQIKRTKIVTATLEVSPAQADRLALGEHEGKLSLAVRSLTGTAQRVQHEAVDLEELLSLTKPAPTPPETPAAVPSPPPPTVKEPATRRVLAPARELPVGTLLREEDLTQVEIATGDVGRGHVLAEGGGATEALRGYAVRKVLNDGVPLTWSSVVGPRQRGFLAAVLKPGTRAVTIRLGAGARHAGLIDPGDRVDVILTAKLRLADGVQSVFTRTILEDVRVVAVDRRVGGGTEPSQGSDPVKRTEIVTATLEVSPTQADRLALGEHQGTLSLAVRSLAATASLRTRNDAVDLQELLSLPTAEPETESPAATPPPVKQPEKRRVVTTVRDLTVGTLLQEDDLTELTLEQNEITRGYVLAEGQTGFDALRGHATRETIAAGVPLTWSSVVGPGQRGFLAAVLKPGTRAVTIRLGAGTRHAGLIDPGDRVDVILTAKLRLADGVQSVLTRRILEDVRVVAVDRQLGSGADSTQADQQVKRTKISTATLEVLPAQADRLALGEHQGTLSLAVRSLATAVGKARGEVVDLRQLLARPAPKRTKEPTMRSAPELPVQTAPEPREAALAPPKTVRIIRGDKLTRQTFSDSAGPRSEAVQVVPRPDPVQKQTPGERRSGSEAGISR